MTAIRTSILGVQVATGLTCAGLLETIGVWMSQTRPRTVAYVNAHCLNLACSDPEYRRILNQADLVYPDGIGVVWAGRFLAGAGMTKLTGADWIDDFCACAAQQGWKLYILAGKEGIADLAARKLQDQFPGLQVVGACSGYFAQKPSAFSRLGYSKDFFNTETQRRGDQSNKSDAQVLSDINASGAQVVLIGMGTPLQEKWLSSHRTQIAAPLCWTVGALFDYVAGIERRVPAWLNTLGLEWWWRFWMDPGGKWRRYWLGNPSFVARVLLSKWKGSQ